MWYLFDVFPRPPLNVWPAGLMLFWPGWLDHFVEATSTGAPAGVGTGGDALTPVTSLRVAVSFNLGVRQPPPPSASHPLAQLPRLPPPPAPWPPLEHQQQSVLEELGCNRGPSGHLPVQHLVVYCAAVAPVTTGTDPVSGSPARFQRPNQLISKIKLGTFTLVCTVVPCVRIPCGERR